MNTPIKLGKRERDLPSSQQPTPIVLPPSQQPTPIVQIPKKQRTIHGTNLRNAFEEEQHNEHLRQIIEAMSNYKRDYDDRVEETANMVFRLPKKGGKQSTKRAKNHRKKTLKKRVRK